jgi:hypothetical protein
MLTALLVLLGLAAPAGAATYHHRDRTHDVNDTSHPPCPTCFPVSPAPADRTEDIVGFGVDFGATTLHLSLGTRAVPRNSPVPQVSWSVATSSGLSFLVVVVVGMHGRAHVEVRGGGKKCSDTRAGFSDRPRFWTADLSLTCLRGASWVQVGGTTNRETFSDDAMTDGRTCCTPPAPSPKVRRG